MIETTVARTQDFQLDGTGQNTAWEAANWLSLTPCEPGDEYQTRAKILYSERGLYVLFDCVDDKLSCQRLGENGNLFTQDVVEFFVWPKTDRPIYFEYELSPLDEELVLLVPNDDGNFFGWLPWHYEGGRRCEHATHIRDGAKEPYSQVTGWSAEAMIPYELFIGLTAPPQSGDQWRANFYRIDHDHGATPTTWAWSKVPATNFHDYKNFGQLTFA